MQKDHSYKGTLQEAHQQSRSHAPTSSKTSQETMKSSQKFFDSKASPTVSFTYNFLKFGKACEDLCLKYCILRSHRSETSGVAERAALRVKEGTSATFLQSGLDAKWCANSMEGYWYLPITPFGSVVEHHPISLHRLGEKGPPGIFSGFV